MKQTTRPLGVLTSGLLVIAAGTAAKAANLVVNGDFTQGNTGFTSGYGYAAPSGDQTLWDEGLYTVGSSSQAVHANFRLNNDHTTGSGNMMIVNGNPASNVTVWTQDVTFPEVGTFYFSFYASSVFNGMPNPANLTITLDGAPLIPFAQLPDQMGWTLYNASGAVTTVGAKTVRIVNNVLALDGNDFAIDDIRIDVTPIPEPTTAAILGGFGLVALLRRRKS